MLLGLVALAVVLALLLRADAKSSRATVDELASARAIAAARLSRFADEREERFRHYRAKWPSRPRQRPAAETREPAARGYVVPFRTETRR